MNMINAKCNGDLATIQMSTNQREPGTWHCADSTENPFAPIRIVDSGVKDEQLNLIQMYKEIVLSWMQMATRSGHRERF